MTEKARPKFVIRPGVELTPSERKTAARINWSDKVKVPQLWGHGDCAEIMPAVAVGVVAASGFLIVLLGPVMAGVAASAFFLGVAWVFAWQIPRSVTKKRRRRAQALLGGGNVLPVPASKAFTDLTAARRGAEKLTSGLRLEILNQIDDLSWSLASLEADKEELRRLDPTALDAPQLLELNAAKKANTEALSAVEQRAFEFAASAQAAVAADSYSPLSKASRLLVESKARSEALLAADSSKELGTVLDTYAGKLSNRSSLGQ